MYLQHFGLSQPPFSATPNTQFFLELNNAGSLFKEIIQTVNQTDGFITIIGEAGMGKSTLYRKLLKALHSHKSRYKVLGLAHPPLNAANLYSALGQELDISRKPTSTLKVRILGALLNLAATGKRVVLVIDEAQAMSENVLVALHLLSEHQFQGSHLLRIALFAHPEFNQKIGKPRLQPLRERITVTRLLQPVDAKDIFQYVTLRLDKCQQQGEALFSLKAINLLAKASGGVPRLINLLAHKAMMRAFDAKETLVDEDHMAAAISDTASANPVTPDGKTRWLSRKPHVV
ncbi:MAG: AAA family ATPase [Pseudomonadota bacterium]